MYKKNIVIYLLIIVFCVSFYNYYFNSISTFKYYENDCINTSLITNYLYGTYEKKLNSENEIKTIVLNDILYEDWLDQAHFIKLKVLIINNKLHDPKLIITLTLRYDSSVIVIYDKVNNTYYYKNKIENLVNIEDTTFVFEEKLDTHLIFVYEFLEENMGAYFEDYFLRVFMLIDNSYVEVFRKSLEYQITLYNKWINPKANLSEWYKYTENSKIQYSHNIVGLPIISSTTLISSFIAEDTPDKKIPVNFKPKESFSTDLEFTWNDKLKYFVLDVVKVLDSNEIVGIIEVSDYSSYKFIQPNKKYFKIINNNGKIRYVNQNEVSIIKD